MSGGGSEPLTCDMIAGCPEPVTHIDAKGYVYCRAHGRERQAYQRCRQLTAKELRQLKAGEPLKEY